MKVRKYNEAAGVFDVYLSPREMEMLSERELPELETDTDTDREVRAELKAAAAAADATRREAWDRQKAAIEESAREKRNLERWRESLEYHGLSLDAAVDEAGRRVARDAAGNVVFRWKGEGQFRARLQRWIFT